MAGMASRDKGKSVAGTSYNAAVGRSTPADNDIEVVHPRRVRTRRNKELKLNVEREILEPRSHEFTGMAPDESAQIEMAVRESLREYALQHGNTPRDGRTCGSGSASYSANQQTTLHRLHAMMREKVGGELIRWNVTRSESTLILDEFDDNESESPMPCRVIIDELGMAEEDVGLLKRKLDFGNSSGKKKRSVRLEEDEEDSVEDFESDSAQGSITYVKSSDSSSEEDDDDVDKED
ncbi:hypothetical protein ABZP36_014335 [Zizania latifolia]